MPERKFRQQKRERLSGGKHVGTNQTQVNRKKKQEYRQRSGTENCYTCTLIYKTFLPTGTTVSKQTQRALNVSMIPQLIGVNVRMYTLVYFMIHPRPMLF